MSVDKPDGTAKAPLQTIGEVSWLLGVSAGTLRLWESQGLIAPTRTQSGRRGHSAGDVATLRRVQFLRTVQRLNAAAIKQILDADGTARRHATAASPGRATSTVGGRDLRRLRRQHGMTLRQAADVSGLSVSFISSVERDVTGASPTAITRLLGAYHGGASELRDDGRVAAHRMGDAQPTTVAPGVQIEWLSAYPGLLEPQYYLVTPGAASEGIYEHKGEEFLFVLQGIFTIWIEDERHVLGAGSSLHFPSHLPHRWKNESSEEARLLWITTERGVWRKGAVLDERLTSREGSGRSERRNS